jgi:hypothetical protein
MSRTSSNVPSMRILAPREWLGSAVPAWTFSYIELARRRAARDHAQVQLGAPQ